MSVQPIPISPNNFAAYGKVARRPKDRPLAETPAFKYWSDVASYRIKGDTEVGFCTVYRQPEIRISWMERHDRTPEILIPADRAFLLPVMRSDEDGGQVEVFRVEPGEAVVIGDGVWHSACIPANGNEATYFVIFRRGTPHEDVIKKDIPPVTVKY